MKLVRNSVFNGSAYIFALFCLNGCRNAGISYMPMKKGREWSYLVRNAKQSTVEKMVVVRSDAVAHQHGYLLRGGGSESRLAWKNGVLFGQELTNTWYSPPIPILDSRKKQGPLMWSGQIESPLFRLNAKATITTSPKKLIEGGKTLDTLYSLILVSVPSSNQTVELRSWFESRIGLVRQEERVDGVQTSAIELLSGP